MEEFRKKLEKRLKNCTIVCLYCITIYFVLVSRTKDASDFEQILLLGVFAAMELIAVYNLTRTFAVLRNEEKLKEMYIAETDERNIAIQKETSQTSLTISTKGIAMAAIAAGFFDVKICITLTGVLLFRALVTIIVKAYYNKKM